MRRPWAALLPLAFLAVVFALSTEQADAQQASQTLVSNFGQANGGTGSLVAHDHAQAFTTGPNAGGYEVTGVDLRFDTVAAGLGEHLVVHVRRDGGGSPGTRVGTLTEPAFTASAVPTKYTFTHSGLRLEPDTTYWVTVDQDASTVATGSRLSTTASDAENAGGAAGFSIANVASWKPDATFTWSSVRDLSGGRSLYLGVTGAALPAEPGVPATLSNLEMPDGGAHNLTSDRAVSFTTGNNGDHHALESVEIEFAQVSDSAIGSKLEVAILGDSSGAPNWGDRLAMLTNPTFQTGSADRTYTFSYDGAGLRLAPDTTYWVAAFNSNRDLSGTNSIRGTTSASERLVGLPMGWSIANDSREWSRSTSSWNTQAEPLKIGLNLGAADPFVQFRTCEGTVSGDSCSTGWVTANYTRYDPPPAIELMEGGAAVTFQWRAVDPRERRHFYVAGQVVEPRAHFGGYIGAGGPDRDRLICHTGDTARIGDPIVYVAPQAMVVGIGYGSTAGPLLDRHDGCPFRVQSVYEHDPNKWRPVSVAAGQDSDAFDHTTFLILEPYSVGHWFYNDEGEAEYAAGFGYPEVRLPLIIRDDDEWENDIVFSVDNGTTWTSIEDGGLDLAFPRSLNNGFGGQNYAHRFWVRLKNDPSTITGAPASKRFSVIAHAPPSPISSGTQAEFEAYYVCLRSPAADELHTFNPDTCSGGGSAEVSYTPIQVEIHVGVSVTGSIRFEVEGYHLYERWDTQISTETPKKRVRTKSFSFDRTLGSCVGCQLLAGELPDPVVERVGDLSYANLSESGIDLSWPLVVGAEGYQVRWWSTTSPFPGVPAEEAWFGAEPSDPAWGIRYLEPETEYRAVVYYQDHGATQLSTASPVIRFTTLSAGSPVEAEPTSVIVERVPEVSISAAAGRITEGEDATFTVTVEPAPDAPLDVKVHVVAPAAAGGVVNRQHLGTRTVNVGTTGSATFTIPTVDDASWDANGMLGATVDFGDGYRRSAFGSFASVNIANNDLPPPPPVQLKGISDTTATIAWKPQGDGATYLVVWHKAHSGIPVLTEVTTTETQYEITGLDPGSYYTVSVLAGGTQLRVMTVKTLAAGAAPKTFTVDFETPDPNTSVPVISVTADGDVTEGAPASFTVTANPAPDADLDVSVTVAAEGDYGAAVGQRTVTIPVAGHVTVTVATTDDQDGEAGGSVTVTVDADADGGDYLVSPTQGAATVAVADDDGPDYSDYQTVVDLLIDVRDNPPNTRMRNNAAHIYKWNRVLAAIGHPTSVPAMPASEIHDNAARWPDSAFHAASVYLTSLEQPRGQGQQQTPEISISAGGGVTEGGDAVFTLTAGPAPAADLDVTVTVTQSGDYGATTGQRTVTVPTSGAVTFTVATTDDQADETDGSVTATLNAGSDYTVSATQGAATVAVADNDDPPRTGTDYQTVVNTLIKVRDNPPNTRMRNNPAHILKWNRVLAAIGYDSGETAMPASEIHDNAAKWPHSPFKAASDYLRSQEGQGQQQPEVNISGGSAVSEGGSVSFTLTASPAPTALLDVSVTISVTGDFGVTAGTRTVTIPTSGSATLTLATTDDQADEADGTVTATLATGSGYTIGSQSSQTADVADNDDPPPMAVPVVNIAGGGGVTEGDAASFTLTASPAPASNLSVRVTVTASGDYGITTGTRTVTVPASGTATFTVATSSDQTDEADGSVTVTLIDGTTYDLGTSKTATVAVADDDPPDVDGQDGQDQPVLTACEDKPELTISNPEASRNDTTVDFQVSLSCIPDNTIMILLTPVRDGTIGQNRLITLTSKETTVTVTVTIGDEDQLALALVWGPDLNNREAQGNVNYTH